MKIQNKINIIKLNSYAKIILRIIHKFHSIIGNRILFVGNSSTINKRIINKTQHIFIPASLWGNGLITNKLNIFQQIINKKFNIEKFKISRIFFKFKKRPNLIVILNNKESKIDNILKEVYNSRIPLLIVNSLGTTQQYFSQYKIPKTYLSSTQSYLFFELLHSVLKLKPTIKRTAPKVLQKWQQKKFNFKKNNFKFFRKKKNVNKKK